MDEINEIEETTIGNSGMTLAEEKRHEKALKATGFDYEYSRLTEGEMRAAMVLMYQRVRQYEVGIITGGELDCLFRNGVMPIDLT